MDWLQYYYDGEKGRMTNAKRHLEMTGKWPHDYPDRFDYVGGYQPNMARPKRLPGSDVCVRDYYNGYELVGWVDGDNNFHRYDIPASRTENIGKKIYNPQKIEPEVK